MFHLVKIISKPRRIYQCSCFCTARKSLPDPPDSSEDKKFTQSGVVTPTDATNKIKKEDLQWRTPWHQKEGEYYTYLRSFYSDDNQTSLLKIFQTPINLSPTAIKKWWARKMEHKDIMMQSYLPERNQTLGNDLAAAHFIVYREGAVKFFHQDKWIKANKFKEYDLPKFYESDKILQAIDCSNMNLYYEGLLNLRDLKQVEWLSLNGVDNVDDWYLDRVSHIFSHSLLYLDIRNCHGYTERGLGSLYKMQKLKILRIDDMMSTSFEMTCLMLQETNPNLDIKLS